MLKIENCDLGSMFSDLAHLNLKAKGSMLEMVTDIRHEFARILDEVRSCLRLPFPIPNNGGARSCKFYVTLLVRVFRPN